MVLNDITIGPGLRCFTFMILVQIIYFLHDRTNESWEGLIITLIDCSPDRNASKAALAAACICIT